MRDDETMRSMQFIAGAMIALSIATSLLAIWLML